MCGIFGVLHLNERPVFESDVRACIQRIRHRGPDETGIYLEGAVGLAHARLSIQDLTALGSQPMHSDDNRFILVYNGEIYNFKEIQAELIEKGIRFFGNSDSEVLLRGFERWGQDVVSKLRGMFAFGIWDTRNKTLFLARDRLGKKPLYYLLTDNFFIFASEAKSILAYPGVNRVPNYDAIKSYLLFQYVPAPASAFAGLNRLLPAQMMSVFAGNGGKVRVNRETYWRFPSPVDFVQGGVVDQNRRSIVQNLDEAVELIQRELDEAVRLRLRSDVEVGAFLSGGVDSSIIVSIAAEYTRNLKTFCVSFPGDCRDESEYARRVANQYNCEHIELHVEPNLEETLRELIGYYDEPFADVSALPSFCIAREAAKSVKVVLNGDGGDESFFGYSRYGLLNTLEKVQRIPQNIRTTIATMAKHLPAQAAGGALNRLCRLNFTGEQWYERWMLNLGNDFPSDYIANLGSEDNWRDDSSLRTFRSGLKNASGNSLMERALHWDIQSYLPDNLLVKVDIANMAWALEGRSPFLDHYFMENMTRIDPNLRLKGGIAKYALKKAYEKQLGWKFLQRPKMGFVPPISKWIRNELYDFISEILLGDAAKNRGIYNSEVIAKMLRRHRHGKSEHSGAIWRLFMLELWFLRWIDFESI